MSEERTYGYVLLPIAFDRDDLEPSDVKFAELWEQGECDIETAIVHDHTEGGFPPRFIEAMSEGEAIAMLKDYGDESYA